MFYATITFVTIAIASLRLKSPPRVVVFVTVIAAIVVIL
jgi:hypothetical protein